MYFNWFQYRFLPDFDIICYKEMGVMLIAGGSKRIGSGSFKTVLKSSRVYKIGLSKRPFVVNEVSNN